MTRQAPGTNNSRSPGHHRGPSLRPGHGLRITERDRQLLAFVAAHRFVLACHVRAWLGSGRSVCYRKLARLIDAKLLSYQQLFDREAGSYQVTRDGLAVAGSDLLAPRIELRSYFHDAQLVWLWLAARNGSFGGFERLFSEREMRSHDQRQTGESLGYAIRLLGVDRHGRPGTHYPDLVLVRADRRRVALEFELTLKSRRRLRTILVGYGAHYGLHRVIYLTGSSEVERAVRESASAVGLEELVRVQHAPRYASQTERLHAHEPGSFDLSEVR